VICVRYRLLRLPSECGRNSCLLHAAVKAVTFSGKRVHAQDYSVDAVVIINYSEDSL
jgi:hypothetical protein